MTMNLDVATGWLNYAGMSRVKSYHLEQAGSVLIHQKACEWAAQAAGEFCPSRKVRVVMGECESESGHFVGRFLVVKLSEIWSPVGYAMAISVNTPGGDRRAGATVLFSMAQVKGLSEDVGRAMTLPSTSRLSAVHSSVLKWEGLNPEGWSNPFLPLPKFWKKIISSVFCPIIPKA